MEILDRKKYGKLNEKWMNRVKNVEFLTGDPIRVLKACYDGNNKYTYVTFETSKGIEEFYNNNFFCLAEAMEETKIKIRFIK